MRTYVYLDYQENNMHVKGSFITENTDPLLKILEDQLDISKSTHKVALKHPAKRNLDQMLFVVESDEKNLLRLECLLYTHEEQSTEDFCAICPQKYLLGYYEDKLQPIEYYSVLTITLFGKHPIIDTLAFLRERCDSMNIVMDNGQESEYAAWKHSSDAVWIKKHPYFKRLLEEL